MSAARSDAASTLTVRTGTCNLRLGGVRHVSSRRWIKKLSTDPAPGTRHDRRPSRSGGRRGPRPPGYDSAFRTILLLLLITHVTVWSPFLTGSSKLFRVIGQHPISAISLLHTEKISLDENPGATFSQMTVAFVQNLKLRCSDFGTLYK